MEIDSLLAELRRSGVRITRRDLLRTASLGGLTVAGAALLAACGGDEATTTSGGGASGGATTTSGTSSSGAAAPSTAASSGTPEKGGVWKMAVQGDPVPYPITMPGALPAILACKVMYNTLVKYELKNNAIEVVPDLAESWEANDTLTEYTFKLNPNAKWHDGTPVTADDVKFTFDSYLDPKVNVWGRGTLSAIQSTEVVDTKTVKFITKSAYAPLPVMLGYNRPIAPKHLLEGQDLNQPTEFLKKPIGTGPFKFKQFTTGNFLEMEANPDYFGGAPNLDGVIMKVVPDGNARVAQLKTGEIDFTPMESEQIDAVAGASNVEVREAPQVDYDYLAFNVNQPRFQDLRVRQALAHAIDREAMIKNLLKGHGQVATGPINPLLGEYYNPNVTTYNYDMNKATSLLQEAGWKKGSDGILVNDKGEKFSVRIMTANIFPIFRQNLIYFQQQFKNLGLDVTLDIVEWTVNNDRSLKRDYDLYMSYWITPPDPDIYDHYHSASGSNNFDYKSPEADDLIVKARSEPDHQKRVQLYHQLQAKLAADLPVIWLYYPQEVQGISKSVRDLPLIGYRDALTWMNDVWLAKK